MKTDTAIIKLTLRTNKTLSDGLHPIMLCVQFHGRKEKSTGCACSEDYWDKQNQLVKKGFPNFAQINEIIVKLKHKVTEKRLQFEINQEPYTAEMLLDDTKIDFCGNDKKFTGIVAQLIKERQLKPNTIKNYDLLVKRLVEFMGNRHFIINQLNVEQVKKFAKHLEANNIEKGTIRTILGKLAAVFNYSIEKGIIKQDFYPFRTFNYSKIYPKSSFKRALTKQNIQALEGYFTTEMLYVDILTSNIYYKQGVETKLQQRWTIEFALAIYLLAYKMQGLAFVDMAHLKLEDVRIEEHEIDDEKKKYYIINTEREKTGHPVPIVIEVNDINYSLFNIFLQTAHLRENYIFPILKSNDGKYNYNTAKKESTALITAETLINKNLKKIAVLVNQEIINFCKKTKQEVPPLIREDISFYSVRHSFATHYALTPNCSPIMLAKMMGRSITNIQTYINDLTATQDIIKEKQKMPL